MANDGGHLLVGTDAIDEIRADPVAVQFLREYVGATEMLNGTHRWALWLNNVTPTDLRGSAVLQGRVELTRQYRAASKRTATKAAAATPTLFVEAREADESYLLVPYVSSEMRVIVPMCFYPKETLVRAPSWCLPGAGLDTFGILQSSMFMAWARTVAGRLESRLQLSPGTVYNTFPFPERDPRQIESVQVAAQAVLDVREGFPDVALGDLYHPTLMPPALVAAHRDLDRAVETMFGRHRHTGDASRLRVLFRRYAELTGGDPALFGDD